MESTEETPHERTSIHQNKNMSRGTAHHPGRGSGGSNLGIWPQLQSNTKSASRGMAWSEYHGSTMDG